MNYLNAFIVGGLICLIAQVLIDKFKLLPIHITVLYVTLGAFLEAFGIYDMLINFGHAGAMVSISNFGHFLAHAAVEEAKNSGLIGLLTGIFDLTSSGLAFAIISSFVMALIFKPRG